MTALFNFVVPNLSNSYNTLAIHHPIIQKTIETLAKFDICTLLFSTAPIYRYWRSNLIDISQSKILHPNDPLCMYIELLVFLI